MTRTETPDVGRTRTEPGVGVHIDLSAGDPPVNEAHTSVTYQTTFDAARHLLSDKPLRRPARTQPLVEVPVPGYRHLVRRADSWRQQLYLLGTRITARQLVGMMVANGLTEEQVAAAYDQACLTVEAVREAVAYVRANAELIERECEQERRSVENVSGVAGGPLTPPR